MSKALLSKSLILAALLICAMFPYARGVAQQVGDDQVVIEFQDNGQALINPKMGWTMHFYSNIPSNYGSRLAPSDSLEWFEGCSTVYLRLPWAYLEPEEGVFNWAIVDTPAQRWISKGKKVAFRFTTSENWMEYATPKWVFDAGAKYVRYTWGSHEGDDGTSVDPEFDDPVYLEKLENFLAAAGRRYNGNPNVAFIDVGTYGMWGEGHSTLGIDRGASYSRMTPERTLAVVKKHIDLHKKYFPDTLLCISDDVAGPERPGFDFPETDYAFSQGVSLRDDSILVQPAPKNWFHDDMAQKFWPTLPVILEHEHFKASQERGAWNSELLKKSVEDYHASYMSIHWFPQQEWEEEQETARQINRRLGYRLMPERVSYPRAVKIDEFFDVQWRLQNRGVAPCYDGGFVTLTLKDEQDGIVSVLVDETFDVHELPVGAPEAAPRVERTARFRIGHVAPTTLPGKYKLYLSVGSRDGSPIYELPLDAPTDGQKRYLLGEIELLAK
ncbi:MAG: DUF4832 domain-containing protein [Planctomycetia bacterium]|nr:DUF4832 domain-containing protein [Planctomycetia bacterium]